ncbi:MAG: hypothetical protein RIB47_07945 [Cyclobacteriaceae bacterium]
MAKKNEIHSIALFAGGLLLLLLAWLLKSFPLLIFIAYSPFIAIANRSRKDRPAWSQVELVLVALSLSLFASTFFEWDMLLWCVIESILISLLFLLYTFMRKKIGSGISIITIALFWMALEYVFIKIGSSNYIFLADALQLVPTWVRWNTYTGYLGASLWILCTNLLLYKAILESRKVNWIYTFLFLLAVIGPLVYSQVLDLPPITREQMLSFYNDHTEDLPFTYLARGEYIARTAAWVSVLIVLFVSVRLKTSRK